MENISKILETGSSEEKIKILETLEKIDEPEILEKIIMKLDDDDIQVRGEAYSSLVLNENKISNFLIKNLNSVNKNIRGFTSLVLANRNEKNAIPEIIKLIEDEHGMVRSCAIGALGYLKADKITDIILKLLSDSNLDVQKSALQAAIQVNAKISKNKIEEISKNNDQQIKNLLLKLKK